MNQDFDQDRAGGQKPRRDGEQRSFGRRDDDRSRTGGPREDRSGADRPRLSREGDARSNDRRGDDRRSDDRPRFNRANDESRPRFSRDNNSADRPRFDRSRNDGPRNDGPRNDSPRENRSNDRPRRRDDDNNRPRFSDRGSDRDGRRGDGPARFSSQNDRFGNERRFNDRPERRGRDDQPERPRFDRERNERSNEPRPRFNDGDAAARPRRFNDEAGSRNERPRFDRDRNDQINERPRLDRSRDNRDRNDRFDKPGFKRVGGFQRDADERNRFERDRNDRADRYRPGAPAGSRPDSRPRSDRDNEGRSRDERNREAGPQRFTPEQRKESGERRTGRYDKAPNYNLDQRPYERRDRDDRRDAPRRSGSRPNDRFDKPKQDRKSPERSERSADDRNAEPDTTRLNRYIANSGVCSRREADELIAKGDISVNGKVVTEMGFRVKEGDTVKYGTKVLNPERFAYVLLNKPKDYITTTDDPEERRTVMELVADAGNFRLYPVGRLDRKTTGLLLLTNDGELADKLTHPSNNVRKIYQVEIDKPITEEHFETLQRGIELEDGPIKPDALSIITPDAQVIGIEIHSGRNRIVRRMFESIGYEVTKLDRTSFAGLTKKELPRGKWRFLDPKEVVKLKYLS